MVFSCRIAVHGKWRFLFNFVADRDESHLWEEWDKGLLLGTGVRTPTLRILYSQPDKEWRGTTGGGMRIFLIQRKAIWMKMEEVLNSKNGLTRESKIGR